MTRSFIFSAQTAIVCGPVGKSLGGSAPSVRSSFGRGRAPFGKFPPPNHYGPRRPLSRSTGWTRRTGVRRRQAAVAAVEAQRVQK